MIDHLELQTRDLKAAARFYGDVLEPLGYDLKVAGPAKGFGDGTSLDLFIVEGEPSANVHFAFSAPSRAVVDAIYALARTAGRRPSRHSSTHTTTPAIFAIRTDASWNSSAIGRNELRSRPLPVRGLNKQAASARSGCCIWRARCGAVQCPGVGSIRMAVEIAVDETIVEDVLAAAPAEMPAIDRGRLFLFSGALILLVNFAHPAGGIIDIPVSFFLKNKLHLQANQLAVFKLMAGTPLFLGFMFGFLRDRWSPFGKGDRGHLVIFGLVTALIYGAVTLVRPTYAVLLGGLFVGTMAFQIVGGAAAGIVSAIGQRRAMAGQMSALISAATSLPALISFTLGGLLSGFLEGRDAATAARILFLIAGGMMAVIALCGALGPRSVFAVAHAERSSSALLHDAGRFFRHWPVYPVIVIQMLWQFAPGTGIVLQYHMSNTLHGTDAQWGLWNALFLGSFLPVYIGYGFLCTRVKLGWLLWGGFVLAVAQMSPMLFVHTAWGAVIAAIPMGIIGGVAQAALQDLTIRSCPPGLQGTMMMLFISLYYIMVRFGDLFGAWLYDHHGGFITALWATIGVYALILPALLLVPRRLIATADGEALAVEA